MVIICTGVSDRGAIASKKMRRAEMSPPQQDWFATQQVHWHGMAPITKWAKCFINSDCCQYLPIPPTCSMQLVTIQIFTDCHFFIAIPTHLISFGPFVEFLSCMQAKLKVVRSQNISQKGKIWKLKIYNNSHFLIFKKTNTSFYFSCRKLVKDRG